MIPAKETAFEGKLNDDLSQFSGDFIFPDGSRHPVHVTRKELDNLTSESSPSIPKGILTAEFSPTQLLEKKYNQAEISVHNTESGCRNDLM